MGIIDRCGIGASKHAQKYPEKYVIKPNITALNIGHIFHFQKCSDKEIYPKWTFASKNIKFGNNNFIKKIGVKKCKTFMMTSAITEVF